MKRTVAKKNADYHRVSSFFVTMNTNTSDLVSEAQLKRVAQDYFANLEMEFLHYLHPQEERNNPSYIDNIQIDSTVETGKKEKRVHLHALIRFEHRTRIQIDLKKSVTFFKEQLDLPNVYLHVDFVPDHAQTLKNYMKKDI